MSVCDMPAPDHLFVYGTLAPGQANADQLAGLRGDWQPACVRGVVLPDGWGAAAGYPGLILDDAAGEVRGLLFTSADLAAHWPRLDAFEGEGYVRVTVSVRRDNGEWVQAQVYALAEWPEGLPVHG